MKDIDFDELDKAVNSLMATAPTDKTDEPATPATTVEIPSAADPVTVNVAKPAATVAPVTETASVVTATPAPAAASAPVTAPAVRRGRFMDMVPSTSPGRQTPATSAPASREGLTITPRSSDADTALSTQPTPKPVEPPVSAPEGTASTGVSFDSMPDPIDMAVVDSSEPAPTPITTSAPEVATQPEAIESPFLADAKVEKRPLNPNLGQELEQAAKEESDALDSPNTNEQKSDNGDDEPPITPQVPELSSDLVAIESGETPETAQPIDAGLSDTSTVAPSTPLGATSIAQQYTAKESSGDQSHAAIYDASQYPEPLQHPAKSKSGWLWVLWVIVLLGIGAGGAVLLYVFGIIP